MRKLDDVISIIPELAKEDLDRWINDDLVEARYVAGNTSLTEAQFARVRLICTLRYDMDVEEEILPILLDLLDQLHESRQRLHKLSQAVLSQNEEVKSSILEMLSDAEQRHRNGWHY